MISQFLNCRTNLNSRTLICKFACSWSNCMWMCFEQALINWNSILQNMTRIACWVCIYQKYKSYWESKHKSATLLVSHFPKEKDITTPPLWELILYMCLHLQEIWVISSNLISHGFDGWRPGWIGGSSGHLTAGGRGEESFLKLNNTSKPRFIIA